MKKILAHSQDSRLVRTSLATASEVGATTAAGTEDGTYGKWAPTLNQDGSTTWALCLKTSGESGPDNIRHYFETDEALPEFGGGKVVIALTLPKCSKSCPFKIIPEPPNSQIGMLTPVLQKYFIGPLLSGGVEDVTMIGRVEFAASNQGSSESVQLPGEVHTEAPTPQPPNPLTFYF